MIQSVDLASLKMGSLFRTIFPLLFQWCGGGDCIISLVKSDEIEEDEVTRATANLETKLNCMLRCKNVETTPCIVRNRKHWHVEASVICAPSAYGKPRGFIFGISTCNDMGCRY